MIEIIPVMLFILGWHPDRPGEIDLQRPEVVFTSVEDCEQVGTKMAATMNAAAQGQSGARYEFRCMTIPSLEDFEAALQNRSENQK